MTFRLYNTLTRRVEEFTPQNPDRVTLYVCGPTVYNYVHIGNARPYVVFGLLARLLRRHFPNVTYARNITDVDDKINNAAREAGVPIGTITQRYAAAYREDMGRIGADAPDVEPHATDHIPQIITMCEKLIASGHAYAAESHVLFDVSSYPEYGHLSGRSLEDMIAGARVEVAPYKKNPADFVLWKPSTPDLPGWDSPWGIGRPGWHIECSAMSATHLGETIDIHAGGVDLQFPHHENEVAQSTCAHGGKVFARYWMHNGMLTMDGKKMSKSVGNTVVLHELLGLYPAEVLRYVLLKAHYRQPLDWSEGALRQARATLDGWYGVLRDLADVPVEIDHDAVPAEFETALLDDLNTPEALAIMARVADAARKAIGTDQAAAAKRDLLGCARMIGLATGEPEAWFKQGASSGVDAAAIEQLILDRNAARAAREFAKADEIRKTLADMGVTIEDGAQGTRWRVASQ
ncbi:cysteine--tRNA ligase [Tahibacter amnicola]|uniref:Cysteine--tRNA ligase n=1 Tax=Tahibacter amnicola TaxID=2976241 RepID=A0ABY6BK15_9GAMM|nr:cysteine--tRNA ligase [Tahibacter amnicola]UXI69946.1 cysteine--tRNA ligase [Tahibacter amnicola]